MGGVGLEGEGGACGLEGGGDAAEAAEGAVPGFLGADGAGVALGGGAEDAGAGAEDGGEAGDVVEVGLEAGLLAVSAEEGDVIGAVEDALQGDAFQAVCVEALAQAARVVGDAVPAAEDGEGCDLDPAAAGAGQEGECLVERAGGPGQVRDGERAHHGRAACTKRQSASREAAASMA
jgi:hypothetical protein